MAGRPSKMTPEVVSKLEDAFSYGASVNEACYNADISRETFYRWMREDEVLYDRLKRMMDKPILKARKAVVDSFNDKPELALKYLEKKLRKEFGDEPTKMNINLQFNQLKLMSNEELYRIIQEGESGSSEENLIAENSQGVHSLQLPHIQGELASPEDN